MTREAIAERVAARHVVSYLLDPARERGPVAIETNDDGAPAPPAESGAASELIAREGRAIAALARALLERGTLAGAEADLIVDVARGDATPADLRHYRALNRQGRCGLE